ncbi:MAG: ATP-binding cassette domain-containing protein [Ignavibacteriales bacterium]|nr:ATP-binding cassette domain-containing protein [Ignavibacteriales bacterium]
MAITVRNLTKYYGQEPAIDDISFDVKTGEILGFLGPNGAGKTTTMKIITCYMPPTSGTVDVDGYSIADHSLEVRRKIGYLPELNPLYLDMNVVAYLEYAAQLHGLDKGRTRQQLAHMVEVCGLKDVRHKDIGELSKGYRQRVGLAQAMIHEPEVLILDEPTSGLDPNQIVEIRNLIKQLGRAKTVILSTHILSEVQATCDRVIIVNEGSIVADGTPSELREKFHGSESVMIEIKAAVADPMAELLPKLKSIEGVESVEYSGGADNLHRFSVGVAKGNDVREELFRQAVAQQWVLLEMSRKGTSLEEVFHKLTQTEDVRRET